MGGLGVEIELLAPAGSSRRDLADSIAKAYGGKVRRFFHPQGEPSKAVNTPFFENLTLGFVVEDAEGNVIAQCVDDLTLQDDLERTSSPQPGWYRIVSDDARLLRLTALHCDAERPVEDVLKPVAEVFRTTVEQGSGGMMRVTDSNGASIALAAPLPGERERPCELITRPIWENHLEELERLLGLARELNFSIPKEGAIHLHFDGKPLRDASTIANLVRFLGVHSEGLQKHFGTNAECRRLGAWPASLFELVGSPAFPRLKWEDAKELLAELKLTKYCDFNLVNLIRETPEKCTFEVRILPVWLEAERIMDAAELFSAILDWAATGDGNLLKVPDQFSSVLP